jgi:hypothetical protein
MRAAASPHRVTLLPPDVAVASVDTSSPTAQVVLLPPASTPRKIATAYFYHTHVGAEDNQLQNRPQEFVKQVPGLNRSRAILHDDYPT